MLIISRASNLDYQTVTQDNLKVYIGEETYQLALDIIKDFNSYFYIDLSAPEFFVRFALHIKNVLIRAHSNYFSKNPLTESIKQNCPLIYDCAVNAARLIHERTGIYLNDDEIAYIAFHIGGALEMQSSIQDKISVCIYCPNYYNLNSKLSERISSIFKDRLIVSSIATNIASLQKSSSDLIISTLPGDLGLSTPAVTISPFLTSQEQSAISRTIDDLTRQKKQALFRDNLRLLIHDELFEVRDSFDSKEQVIHYLADKLKQLGYVGDTFEEEVLERDGLSSTAFGSFAIPHAMKMHEKKTAVNILLLRNPMSWDDRPVQLIMMLCFNRDDRYIFNEIFEPITMVLTSKDNLRKLLTVSSSAEFIDLMSSMME
jgi:lichenan operon transcriptional antiterminator